mmetsp:Transcript_30638/g.73464  ORF Transcript_30638/g.73464 Transcript_30638/m.73464 type:complete len:1653 (+) Transcript_30638:223-5181(+)
MDSLQEPDYVVPLEDNLDVSQRSRSYRRRSSGHSLEGSTHSMSSYTFEEVESVHSEYSFETLEDSFQNSFASIGDVPSDSLGDMKNYLRNELGLEIQPVKALPKKEEPKKEALTEMQIYLRSELGLDIPQKASSSSSGPQNSTVSFTSELSFSSVSVDNSKKSAEIISFEDSELARSIAALKEGVDIEEIEFIESDDEFGDEIIDDVFDHMGGLDGRDTVLLESYGLHSILEVADSEYASEMDDDSEHLKRISESSIMSDFPLVGDLDEVDTEPNEPQSTGLHETVIKSHEQQLDRDIMDVDETVQPAIQKATSPTKSGNKAAKWKDRLKKRRSKSDGGHSDDDKMDIDSTPPSDQPESQEAVSTKPAQDADTGPSNTNSPKSESETENKKHETEEKKHDGSPMPTKTEELPDSQEEPKADEVKPESDSKTEMSELTLSKPSPKSKSKRGKKASKWKDRIQKRRSKSIEQADDESNISSPPKSFNSPADTNAAAAGADAENDLKEDSPNVPIHVANDKRTSLSEGNTKSEQVRDEPESLGDLPVGDIVMKVDGVLNVNKANAESSSTDIPPTVRGDRARATEKQDSLEAGTLPIPSTRILGPTGTLGEREGDEENYHGESTTHSMRIFDDEFGSVGVPNVSSFDNSVISFDRSGRSFDRTSSNDIDSLLEQQDSIDFEEGLKDETSNRKLRVFDDELGENASFVRSSIYSQRSSQSTILGELDEDDEDDGTSSEDDSLLSEEDPAGPNEIGVNVASTSSAANSSRNKAKVKSSRESNGETESENKIKFELPNELLEAINCHHSKKNVVDEKQSDRDVSNGLATQSEAPVENEKDGSATYSTLPQTFEDSSGALGDEAVENTDAGISTPELIDEASQDCTRSDEETAQTTDTAQMDAKVQKARKLLKEVNDTVDETQRDNDAKKSEARSTIKVFPGRLPPDQRVMDKETGKTVSFLAAFEMTTKHRRRAIVLSSALIALEGVLAVSASSEALENKYSKDVSRGGNQELIESLKATSRMATRAGRKKLVMESTKAMMPKESWVSSIFSIQDDSDEQASAATTRKTVVKPSADHKASGRKTSSKLDGSKRSKADGRNIAESNKPTKNSTSKHKKRTKGDGLHRSQSDGPKRRDRSTRTPSNLASSGTLDQSRAPSNDTDTLELSTKSEPAESMDFKENLDRGALVDNSSGDGWDRQKENTTISEEGKMARGTDGSKRALSKTRSRKRSKTRSKKTPRRSRSLGTEDFLESLNPTESMDQTGTGSDGKDDTDGKVMKSTRNRTRSFRRSRSMGPMESSRLRKRKEKSNGEVADTIEGCRSEEAKEKTADSPCEKEKLAPSRKGKDPLPEFAEPMSPRTEPSKSRKELQNTEEEEDSDVLLSPSKSRRRKSSERKAPKVEKPNLRRRKSGGGGKSPKNGNRKTLDKTRSPSSRKKSVNLVEDRKDEMKSPKKNRSNSIEMRSPKVEKSNLRRRKSSEGKSPRTPNRKSIDKVRTPITKKKTIDAVPDLEDEFMSPNKSQFNRRSLDSQSPKPVKKPTRHRRHSDSPLDKSPPLVDNASRQRRSATDQPSAFMEYYDSMRGSPESRKSILKNGDDLLALQIPDIPEALPSPSPSTKQRKSKLRRGQSDSVIERVEPDPPVGVDDIWGLVKWRDQVDRL